MTFIWEAGCKISNIVNYTELNVFILDLAKLQETMF